MLIISYGGQREHVIDIEPASSAFASCLTTLANGLIGIRPYVPLSCDRTRRLQLLAAGVYAPGVGVAREIVSLPAPGILRIYDVDTGEPALPVDSSLPTVVLSMDESSVISTERLCIRGGQYELTVLQFIDVPNTAAVSVDVELRRIDGAGGPQRVRMDFGIDACAVNEYLGTASWLTARHYEIEQCNCGEDSFSMIVAVGKRRLRYDVHTERWPGAAGVSAVWALSKGSSCAMSATFDFAAAGQHRLCAHWRVSPASAPSLPPADFASAQAGHRRRWSRLWKAHGVAIHASGDPVELGIRYAVFELLQQGIDSHGCASGAISPARGLTSTYHSGATFFDTELHKCAFWTWNDPRVARALLDFRYHTLEAAIEFAQSTGFSGARFPEASNDCGAENGPHYVLSYPDAQRVREWSVDEVLHISADVCFALARYWEATGDEEYMNTSGCRIVVECARFAASAFEWSDVKQAYVIESVMGPDEYHYHVNNSFFTNYLLRWCIRFAISLVDRESFPPISPDEVRQWHRISENVHLPWMTVDGISIPEEFDGYAALREAELRIDKRRGPRFADEGERDSARRLQNFATCVIKQADIILLMAMFPDDFSDEVKRTAYCFYEPRTVHDSSLSYGPHAVVAADIGDTAACADYIARASRYNLDFTPVSDYCNGLHLSAYAGAWQGLVEGLAGLRVTDNRLSFKPQLPPHWDSYQFPICFRGKRLKVNVLAEGGVEIICGEHVLHTERGADGRIHFFGGDR
ncbi:glycosyl hydrolase family 65 protein [Cupriavidus necator]|uniref:glycosyl hydrolase family 65 protein n=1 Tax=Cupriavidus necator TaxID=106590 RepID=UPI00339D5CDC